MTTRNWAGNVEFGPAPIRAPETLGELRELVRSSRKLRVLGSRHSFNDIAASPDLHLSLERLSRPPTFDRERQTVTCSPGVTYGELCPLLDAEGVALRNLASLPHISVMGACSTATHGSGDGNQNLATAVVELELVDAHGEVRRLSRDAEGDAFSGQVVSLGGLGVVTEVTLATVPAFSMQQEVFEDLPVAGVYERFDEITSCAYSVSLFTDWRDGLVNQVWIKHRLDGSEGRPPATGFLGARPAPTHRHPMTELSPDPCTTQMGQPGPWHERLPHFRVDHTPASGDELQTEYFVPRAHAVQALQALEGLADEMAELLWLSEVRTIAADELWLSPSYRTPTIGIHFSWHNDWEGLQGLLPVVEEALAPLQVRPHWGKVFTLKQEQVASQYPRLDEFKGLLRDFDPDGKFRNPYLERYLYYGCDGRE